MKEEIINGIKYRLDEETLTAEVIELKDDLELDETKMTAEKLMKMMSLSLRPLFLTNAPIASQALERRLSRVVTH